MFSLYLISSVVTARFDSPYSKASSRISGTFIPSAKKIKSVIHLTPKWWQVKFNFVFIIEGWENSRHSATPQLVSRCFPAKRRLRNERRNFILITYDYPHLASASDWLKMFFPIRSTPIQQRPHISFTSEGWNCQDRIQLKHRLPPLNISLIISDLPSQFSNWFPTPESFFPEHSWSFQL